MKTKFRAWDKKRKQYHYLATNQGSQIHLRMNNEHWAVFDDEDRLCGSCDDSGVLEQWTGLKDKNGVDIYEGDIVKVKGIKKVGEYKTKIFYDGSGFYLEDNETYFQDRSAMKLKMEVI